MNVLLYRVDDRLIHGQVVLGWGRRLNPRRILVVDDRIATDAWERELLGAGVPPEVEARFLTVREAAERLASEDDGGLAFVLLETPASALRLAEAGFVVPSLNVGGLHREGGRQAAPYVSLWSEDVAALRALAALGVEVYAQDVPDGRRVEAGELLGETDAVRPARQAPR